MSPDREKQLTHMAKRLNLEIIKSKAKKWMPDDHQQYRIVDINNVIQAGKDFDMRLDDVEKFLQEREAEQASMVNPS